MRDSKTHPPQIELQKFGGKQMKKRKGILNLVAVSLLVEILSLGCLVQPVYAKSNWKNQYWKYLGSMEKDYVQDATYHLIYVNNDTIPELVIEDSGGYHMGETVILTTDGKKVDEIGGRYAGENLKYAKKANAIYFSAFLGAGCHGDYVFKISKGKWKIVACGTTEISSEKNLYWWTNGKRNELGELLDSKGQYTGKSVSPRSEASYNKKLKNALTKYKIKNSLKTKCTYKEIKKKLEV